MKKLFLKFKPVYRLDVSFEIFIFGPYVYHQFRSNVSEYTVKSYALVFYKAARLKALGMVL